MIIKTLKVPQIENIYANKLMKMKLRYEISIFLAHYPQIYIPYTHWRDRVNNRGEYGGRLIDKSTEIIIDGFPRSANSFAVKAFNLAQKNSVIVANHRHDPGQIITAIQKNIPAIVLVREPKNAVASLIIRNNPINYTDRYTKELFKKYLRYYLPIIPYLDKIIVANFETVITDFNLVINSVNSKFETNFNAFLHNEENVNQCFKMIEDLSRKYEGKGNIRETSISRPSEHREEIKKKITNYMQLLINEDYYCEASKVYKLFKANAI
jgi:hypothetical protein